MLLKMNPMNMINPHIMAKTGFEKLVWAARVINQKINTILRLKHCD